MERERARGQDCSNKEKGPKSRDTTIVFATKKITNTKEKAGGKNLNLNLSLWEEEGGGGNLNPKK